MSRTSPTPSTRSFAPLLSALVTVWLASGAALAQSGGPTIDVWYGDQQTFGQIGVPQRWVNVLGNVSDPDGVASLTYQLNGGPALPLSIGPDTRRLYFPGDFNVEMLFDDMQAGANSVLIRAVDIFGNVSTRTVQIDYPAGAVWPLPYVVDWSSVGEIADAAQIVDGKWSLSASGVRPLELGYDRLMAFGDVDWIDYEVTVPITIHGIDAAGGFQWPSVNPIVGLILRWQGHVAWDNSQPTIGFNPIGATTYYSFSSPTTGSLKMGADNSLLDEDPSRQLAYDVTYMWKMRVEDDPNTDWTIYYSKVWEQGQPEPTDWDLSGGQFRDLANGSMLFVAHHVDATFGDVTITPLSTAPLQLTNVQVQTTETTATITWDTNRAATSVVDYGHTTTYELGTVSDSALVTSHSITLNGLTSNTLHHYRLTSVDVDGLSGSTQDLSFVTAGGSDTTPPVLSSIAASPVDISAVISWTTNEPASSRVRYGTTTGYEIGEISDAALKTSHSIPLVGLTPSTLYHFQVESEDNSANVATSGDLTFTTSGSATPPSTIVSDDFSSGTLNTAVWTHIDPLGDTTLTMNGTQAIIDIPAGPSHGIWTQGVLASRLMQAANDTDFEVEVKFESALTQKYQQQGIFVEQDGTNFLRIEFHTDGSKTKLYAASFTNNNPSNKIFNTVTIAPPMYMRVGREGDSWTIRYSSDGQNWSFGGSFNRAMTVTAVGPFAGTEGTSASNAPASTVIVDYFFNTASPIVPEDGGQLPEYTLDVSTAGTGGGSVVADPDQATYTQGASVTLTATPDAGSTFDGWSGDVTSATNPLVVTVNSNMSLTATFTEDAGPGDVTPPVLSNIQSTAGQATATVSWTTNEPATSTVAYGLTAGYELGQVSDLTLKTSHSLQITGLAASTLHHFQVSSTDGAANTSTSGDFTFTTQDPPPPAAELVSDDFSSGVLNTSLWTFVDPMGDSTLTMNGTQAIIDVPAGQSHGIWTQGAYAPRLMQAAPATDWDLIVKFESSVTQRYQQQGIYVVGTEGKSMRCEFHSDGTNTKLFLARFTGTSYKIEIFKTISIGTPSYLKIWHPGNDFVIDYSSDGVNWTRGGSFLWPMSSTQVGVFAGTEGTNATNSPASTVVIDYFFNANSPIVPEDGGQLPEYALNVSTAGDGGGSVVVDPDQATYTAGTSVTLTATPDAGSTFDGWSGDVTSAANPLVVTVNSNMALTATFTEDAGPGDVTPPVLSNIQSTAGQSTATVTWTTDEPATSSVAYGLTTSYELGQVNDLTLKTSHSLQITGLAASTLHHFQVLSVDGSGNSATSGDFTFTTQDPPPPAAELVSDDFSSGVLNTSLWTFVDPLGDSTLTMNGTQAIIDVPPGQSHGIWTQGAYAPRLMQAAPPTDWDLIVKFESAVAQRYQQQGIYVVGTEGKSMRCEFHSDGVNTKLFLARFTGTSYKIEIFKTITIGTPSYLKMWHPGNDFVIDYSSDGVNWTRGGSFLWPMSSTQVGVFAGTEGTNATNAPASSVVIDYFFNANAPIVPEDGGGPADTMPPIVSVTSPSESEIVAGIFTVTADASDNVGVEGVQFLLDGVNLGAEDTTAPFSINWDTANSTNGPHQISAIARDAAGNTATATAVSVDVDNSGGATPIDDDINNLPGGAWYEIPNSQLVSVQYPNPSGNLLPGLFNQVVEKCGAALDTKRNRWIVWGGGSNQYRGNEIYVFDLATYQWSRLNDPYLTPEDNPDSPVHSDGSPIARQTWDFVSYVPEPVDRFVVGGGGGKLINDSFYLDYNTYSFDFDTLAWETKASVPLSIGQGAVSAVAPDGRIWQHGVQNNNNYLSVYDPVADSWSQHAQFPGWFDHGGAADIDPVRNEFVWSGINGTWVWDLDNPNAQPTQLATTGDTSIETSKGGFVYHPPSGKFVAWSGGSSVYTLDPATAVWTRVDTTGAVDPGAQALNGTFSRWTYIPSKDVFFVFSSVNSNIFVYRLP